MTTTHDPNGWRAVIADSCYDVVTDPDDITYILNDEDAGGSLSIRRRSALPDEHGHLPGTWESLDIFGEVDLSELDIEDAEEMWRLMQAAAEGMNQADQAREVSQ